MMKIFKTKVRHESAGMDTDILPLYRAGGYRSNWELSFYLLLYMLASTNCVLLRLRGACTFHYKAFSQRVSALDNYKRQVSNGFLLYDEKQHQILLHLDRLQRLLEVRTHTQCTIPTVTPANETDPLAVEVKRLRGLYLYGSVGTGKTMLMDTFFKSTTVASKRRVHFNDFMLEVHKRIHNHKKMLIEKFGRDIHINTSSARDSIAAVAREIADEAKLLCFDEFQVTDICDAMILSRLFSHLWGAGVVLVATSNRHPNELYLGGLNRQYFLPFIDALQVNCVVRDIGSGCDYRQREGAVPGAYFLPNTAENVQRLWRLFEADLHGETHGTVSVPVMMGRTLSLAAANLRRRVCFTSFAELCQTEKGAADYQALCSHFGTVYMHGIPVLTVLAHNEARRMITLVDALYNNNVRLVWVGDAPPAQLFRVLTAEEVEAGSSEAALGTDHAWTGRSGSFDRELRPAADKCDPDSSTAVDPEVGAAHLRGEEQRRVRPLDSSVFFGTTLTLRDERRQQQQPPACSTGTAGGGVGSSSPVAEGETANGGGGSVTTPAVNTGSGTGQDAHPGPEPEQGAEKGIKQEGAVDAAQEELKVLEGELASIRELSFAFRRAASRLAEMAGPSYTEKWRDRWGDCGGPDAHGHTA